MKLRCALIGCGAIAPTHIGAIEEYPHAEISALCDIREERLQAAAILCPTAELTSDYRTLLDPAKIDVVIVLTEHHNHLAIIEDALRAGVHLLCEKPAVAHPTEIAALRRLLETATTSTGGIFQHRFEPLNITLKKCYEEGLLGSGLTLSMEHRCLRSADYYLSDAWRGSLAQEGGSTLINQSIHFLDLMRFIGGEVEAVNCALQNRTHGKLIETEDTAVGTLIFASGLLGSFACTTSSESDQWSQRLCLAGSKATVTLCDGEVSISATAENETSLAAAFANIHNPASATDEKTYYGGGHRCNIGDFLDAIRSKGQPTITLQSAATTTSLVHALYEAARTKQTITFTEEY